MSDKLSCVEIEWVLTISDNRPICIIKDGKGITLKASEWHALAQGKQDDAYVLDAKRYRWLRAQHWNDGAICCVTNPKEAVRLGTYCPSDERLDEAIDAALAASGTTANKQQKGG